MAYFRSPLLETDGLLGRAAPMQMAPAPAVRPPVVAAPPPAVVAPKAVAPAPANIPSMTDYIAKRLAEAPEYIQDELGNTVFDYSRGDAKFAQEWADIYRPDLRQQGFLINSPWGVEENFAGVTKDRSDIGERWTQFATLNPDGTIGEVSDPRYQKKSAGIKGFIKPVLAVASVIPSPIQPFAQVANAALAVSEGKPLNAALSLYGAANSSGLLGSVGDAATSAGGGLETVSGYNPNGFGAPPNLGGLPADLANSPFNGITGFNPEGFSGGMNAVSVGSGLTSLGGPRDMTPVGTPGLLETPPVVEPVAPEAAIDAGQPSMTRAADSQLANEQLGIKPGENSVAPSAPAVEADPSLIERGVATGRQLLAAGKDNEFYKWVTDPANSLYVRAGMMGGGALLNTVGGTSSSGSSGYKDDGYRPTISRGGFQASIPAPGMPSGGPGMAPGGLASGVTLPSTGQANDGLWRFSGNRPSGLLPGLASAMPRPPQTGLINPPAVANYDPAGGMREMVPTNSPQPGYGYDDPVVNKNPPMSPDMQRALTQFGLLNTNPAPRGWM